jgi:hypothetical protein
MPPFTHVSVNPAIPPQVNNGHEAEPEYSTILVKEPLHVTNGAIADPLNDVATIPLAVNAGVVAEPTNPTGIMALPLAVIAGMDAAPLYESATLPPPALNKGMDTEPEKRVIVVPTNIEGMVIIVV